MKIYPLANLHADHPSWRERHGVAVPCAGADVVVVAGDVMESLGSIDFLERIDAPVVLALGNHDYWRIAGATSALMDMDEIISKIRRRVAGGNVTLLERDEVVIDGVRFLGGTMWSDAAGLRPLALSSGWAMNDFRRISAPAAWGRFFDSEFHREMLQDAQGQASWLASLEHGVEAGRQHGLLNPVLMAFLHDEFVRWFRSRVNVPFEGPTVAVTHHAPSRLSLRGAVSSTTFSRLDSMDATPRFSEDVSSICLAAYYCSSDESLLERVRGKVSLWIHGHVHTSLDYVNLGVRVICNPVDRRTNVVNKGLGLDYPFLIDPRNECQDLIDEASNEAKDEIGLIVSDMARFCDRYGVAPAGVEREALAESIQSRTAKIATVYRSWVLRISEAIEGKDAVFAGRLDRLIPGYQGVSTNVLDDISRAESGKVLGRIYAAIELINSLLNFSRDILNVRRKYLYQCVQFTRKAMDNGGYDFELTFNADGSLYSDLWIHVDIKRTPDLDLEKAFNFQDELNRRLLDFVVELGSDGLEVVVNQRPGFMMRRGVDLRLMVDGEEYFYEPDR